MTSSAGADSTNAGLLFTACIHFKVQRMSLITRVCIGQHENDDDSNQNILNQCTFCNRLHSECIVDMYFLNSNEILSRTAIISIFSLFKIHVSCTNDYFVTTI